MSTQLAAVKDLRQVANVRELLWNNAAREQLSMVAARHMKPERMMRLIANALRTTPKLAECEPMSLLGALMQCAALGLEPQTVLGHAYLIPFENRRKGVVEVQLIVGYKGFKDLARRAGATTIHADVVYDDDEEWSYSYGTEMHLRHKPGPRAGKKTHAYCFVRLKDGQAFVVLPWAEVLRRRDSYSQGYRTAVRLGKEKDHPWIKDEDAMAAKTAVRALANAGDMPMSIELADALEVDERLADFRAFALDPRVGVTVEDEVEPEEEEPAAPAEQEPEQKYPRVKRSAAYYRRASAAGGRSKKPESARDGDPLDASDEGAKINTPQQQPPAEQGEEAPFDPDALPDHHRSLFDGIADRLAKATTPGDVDGLLEMFSDPLGLGALDKLRAEFPGAGEELERLADAARERTAG